MPEETAARVAERLRRAAAAAEQLATSREEAREMAAQLKAALAELDGLHIAMESRAVIERAKGMIMAALRVDADAAFDVLVTRSQAEHKKLHDVAAELVADAPVSN